MTAVRRAVGRVAPCVLALLLFACESAPTVSSQGGQVIWKFAGKGWAVGPSYDSSTVYFGGFNHEVVAVDRTSGALRWRAPTGVPGVVTAGRNTVLAGEIVAMGDVDIYAFDRATGALRWTFVASDLDETGDNFLVTDGQTIYASSFYGRVYAINAATGQLRWVTPLAADSTRPSTYGPTLYEGVVYVGLKRFARVPQTGALAALDAATGRVLWQHEFLPENPGQYSGCFGGAAVVGNSVIVAAEDGRVYALDRTTGDVRWIAPRIHQLPPEGSYNDGRPLTATSDMVVVGSSEGTLVGLDAGTGAEVWRNALNEGSISPMIVNDGRDVFVVVARLFAVDARTGKIRWATAPLRYGDGISYWRTPALAGDRLYVSGETGFYALRKQ